MSKRTSWSEDRNRDVAKSEHAQTDCDQCAGGIDRLLDAEPHEGEHPDEQEDQERAGQADQQVGAAPCRVRILSRRNPSAACRLRLFPQHASDPAPVHQGAERQQDEQRVEGWGWKNRRQHQFGRLGNREHIGRWMCRRRGADRPGARPPNDAYPDRRLASPRAALARHSVFQETREFVRGRAARRVRAQRAIRFVVEQRQRGVVDSLRASIGELPPLGPPLGTRNSSADSRWTAGRSTQRARPGDRTSSPDGCTGNRSGGEDLTSREAACVPLRQKQLVARISGHQGNGFNVLPPHRVERARERQLHVRRNGALG